MAPFSMAPIASSPPPPISKHEYQKRQSQISQQLSARSMLIVPNNPTRSRSRDVNHRYRPSSDVLYLSGWLEEEGVLVAFSDATCSTSWHLFVAPKDAERETWTGRRLGVIGAEDEFPIDQAHVIGEFDGWISENIGNVGTIYHVFGEHSELDEMLLRALSEENRDRQRLGKGPHQVIDPREMFAEARLRKSPAEVEQMRYAAQITSAAHKAAMVATSPDMGEWQIEATLEGAFRWLGADGWAYPSIVGGGDNATILHYQANNAPLLAGDLLLVDAGSEYRGYTSDVTRTWPISGSFSTEQRVLYNLVLSAQEAAINACVVGAPYDEPHNVAKEILAQGLHDLGVFSESMDSILENFLQLVYMHNTSHWIGLDVHDVGVYRPDDSPRLLEEGMVLTIEPGIYIARWRSDLDMIDSRWKGIGVRIEDDVHITSDGPDVLSADCPKTIDEIESLMCSS